MSNLQTLTKGPIIFKNAVKVAGGNETAAKEKLTEKIFKYAKTISKHVFNKLQIDPEYIAIKNLDITNGFGSETVAVIVKTENCFAINEKGDIYSITNTNKYGFRKVNRENFTKLHGDDLGELYSAFRGLLENVVFYKK